MNTSVTILKLKKFTPHLLLLTLLAACASPPDYSIEPAIEFVNISKDTMQRSGLLLDTTFITISFTDGDGDIGSTDSIVSLFAQDSRRDSFVLKLGIPSIPKLGSSNGLKGEITFRAFTSCCLFPPELILDPCHDTYAGMPYDKFTYDIYIEDQAGHRSNVVTTPPIYIRCFE